MNSPLQGGQMRRGRRRPRLGRLLLFLLVPVGAVAVWLVVGEGRTNDPPAAVAGQPALPGTSTRPPPARHGPTPPPGISMIGAKPLRLKFHDPPRAGLAFDLDSGQVLWAHRPLHS